jgi:tripeptidyl-peptidase-1
VQYAVSTPGNPSYGKHWERDQVNTLVQPSDEAVEATVGWLNDANITSSVVGASVHMFATVRQAESLLNTKFSYYSKGGVSKLRTTGYSVHESVSPHIDFIHPTTFFGNTVPAAKVDRISATATSEEMNLSKRQSQSGVDAACTTGLTPACVRQLYNIPANYTPYGNAGASIGFGSFLNESAQESDLLLFENRYGCKSTRSDVHFSTNIIQSRTRHSPLS